MSRGKRRTPRRRVTVRKRVGAGGKLGEVEELGGKLYLRTRRGLRRLKKLPPSLVEELMKGKEDG